MLLFIPHNFFLRIKLINYQKHKRKTSMAFHRLVFDGIREMETQREMAKSQNQAGGQVLGTLWFPRKVWGVEHPDSSVVSKVSINPRSDRVSLPIMMSERNFKILWWFIGWIHILNKASCLPLQSLLLSHSLFSMLQPFWTLFFFWYFMPFPLFHLICSSNLNVSACCLSFHE